MGEEKAKNRILELSPIKSLEWKRASETQKDIRDVGRSEEHSDMVGKAVVSKEMSMEDQSR